MKKIVSYSLFCMFCLLLSNNSFAGPKWDLSDDSWMQLGFLGQVHYANQQDAAVENDFYLRRGRVILSGQIMDGVKFFAETDNDNAGKNGVSVSTDIQDAFLDVRIAGSSHWVEGGLFFVPFSLETFSSAGSLLGIDYNSEAIKMTNTFVWRDYGVMIHGDFGKKVSYRIGFFDGYDTPGNNKNPDAELRYAGHLDYCIIGEAETGWFYTQDKLAKGNYLTIGAGYDNQDKATVNNSIVTDSKAWVVDFQSAFKLECFGPTDLTINGAYYDWDNANFDGDTAFLESGLRISKTMMTLKYTIQNPDASETLGDTTIGCHYFLKNHNARIGVEYRTGDMDDLVLVGIQFLL